MAFYSEGECIPSVDFKILELTVTEQCNLKCIYCYQRDRRNNKKNVMPFSVASAAIEDHLTRDDGFKKVIIELIGGEVFLYFPFIQRLVTWTLERNQNWKKQYIFFIDTNGTLLNEEIKKWLYMRREHVFVGLSLDGIPHAHNLNRSNSYARIAPHIPFLAQTWPRPIAKMTISPKTIPMIFDGVLHIMKQGLRVSANVPMEDIWGDPEQKARHVEKFHEQIKKLVIFFGKNVELPLPNIINLPIPIIASEEHDRPWCGSGRNMAAVEINGREIPCNRYSTMSFNQSLFDQPLAPDTSKCRYCLFKPACQSCEALNWEINGNPKARTSFHCEFTKLQVWGTAQVLAMRLEKGIKKFKSMTAEERVVHQEEATKVQRLLSSIAIVLNEFEKHDRLSDVGMQIGPHSES
jgi:sulfatase maturation enzyme AslB (radical SAM superfamily)